MIKRINRLRNKSFEKTLLDEPVPNKKVKFSLKGNKLKSEIVKLLPKPIKPTKAITKPIPKPRIIPKPRVQSIPKLRVVPKPRVQSIPKLRVVPKPRVQSRTRRTQPKVKKLIDEITPSYKPEVTEAFNKNLKDINYLRDITIKNIKKNALRNRVKSFEVVLRVQKDPAKQLYYTTPGVAEELRSLFNTDGAFKAQITLKVTFKKKKRLVVTEKSFLNTKMHILIVRFSLY